MRIYIHKYIHKYINIYIHEELGGLLLPEASGSYIMAASPNKTS